MTLEVEGCNDKIINIELGHSRKHVSSRSTTEQSVGIMGWIVSPLHHPPQKKLSYTKILTLNTSERDYLETRSLQI